MFCMRQTNIRSGIAKTAIAVSVMAFRPLLAVSQCDDPRHVSNIHTSIVVREPNALNILSETLAVMGGDQWTSVAGVRIAATMAATQLHPAIQTVSIEDFSHPLKPRLSRSTTQGSITHRSVADEELPSVKATVGQRTISVPPTPPLELIATENPAIAIAFALHKGSVSVCMLRNTRDIDHPSQEVKWIRIFHRTSRGAVTAVDLAISNSTLLPVRARRMLPSLSHFAPAAWEDVEFIGFASQSGLMFPTAVHIGGSSQVPSDITFEAVQLNPAISSADFPGDSQ